MQPKYAQAPGMWRRVKMYEPQSRVAAARLAAMLFLPAQDPLQPDGAARGVLLPDSVRVDERREHQAAGGRAGGVGRFGGARLLGEAPVLPRLRDGGIFGATEET